MIHHPPYITHSITLAWTYATPERCPTKRHASHRTHVCMYVMHAYMTTHHTNANRAELTVSLMLSISVAGEV